MGDYSGLNEAFDGLVKGLGAGISMRSAIEERKENRSRAIMQGEQHQMRKELHAHQVLKMRADEEDMKHRFLISAYNDLKLGVPLSKEKKATMDGFLQTDKWAYDDARGIDVTNEDGVVATIEKKKLDALEQALTQKTTTYGQFKRGEKDLDESEKRYFMLQKELTAMGQPKDSDSEATRRQRLLLTRQLEIEDTTGADLREMIKTAEPYVRPNLIENAKQAGRLANEDYTSQFGQLPSTGEESKSFIDTVKEVGAAVAGGVKKVAQSTYKYVQGDNSPAEEAAPAKLVTGEAPAVQPFRTGQGSAAGVDISAGASRGGQPGAIDQGGEADKWLADDANKSHPQYAEWLAKRNAELGR